MKEIIKKLARIIATKLMPEIPYRVIRGPLKGVKIIHGAFGGPSGGASVYFNLIEKKQTTEFLNRVNKGDTVFDIGANVGYYTILSSKKIGLNGRVFSFEPVVRNLSYLYRHMYLNDLHNVVILPLACSNIDDLVEFSYGPNTAQGHLLEVKESRSINKDFLSLTYVHTITIDAFVLHSGNIPNVIKIDVEGAELLVLKGGAETLRRSKPIIFLSIHSEQLENNCKEYLAEFGYKFILLDEKERPSVEYLCL